MNPALFCVPEQARTVATTTRTGGRWVSAILLGVARWEIVGDQSTFDVRTRPAMAAVGASVSHAAGVIELSLDDAGRLDADRPISGSFSLTVATIHAGNDLVAAAVQRFANAFMSPGQPLEITSKIGVASADGRDAVSFKLTVHAAGRDVALTSTANLRARDDGDVEVSGATMCDPRSFGVALPPLVNLMVHIRWRVELRPASDTKA